MATERPASTRASQRQGGDASADARPRSWVAWGHRLGLGFCHALLGLTFLSLFADFLWLGAVLRAWAPLLALALLPFLAWLRRNKAYALTIIVFQLACTWPWLRAAYETRLPMGPETGAGLRLAVVDLTGYRGSAEELEPALAVLAADILVVSLEDDERDLDDAVRAFGRVARTRNAATPPDDHDGPWPHRLLLIAIRREVEGLRVAGDGMPHFLSGANPGFVHAQTLSWQARELRLVSAWMPPWSDPRFFRNEVDWRQRLSARREAGDPFDGVLVAEDTPVLALWPRAWVAADPRWRALRAATGVRRPAGPAVDGARFGAWTLNGDRHALLAATPALAATALEPVVIPGAPQTVARWRVGWAPAGDDARDDDDEP